jgi:hypothetical protein
MPTIAKKLTITCKMNTGKWKYLMAKCLKFGRYFICTIKSIFFGFGSLMVMEFGAEAKK